MIGSMEVLIYKIKEPIVIWNQAQPIMQKVKKGASACKLEAEDNKLDFKYFQSRWCPSGLTQTQRRKLGTCSL